MRKMLTLKKLREIEFSMVEFERMRAQYETVTNIMDKLEEACDELNKDVRDAFYVAGTSKEGDRNFLHIVTSGKEGEEEARRILRELSDLDKIEVKCKVAERVREP